jgi:hypothetical protein
MSALNDVSYFFGGVFLSNALPHYLSGVMGRAFQTPFARPRGVGLASSTVNILWGCANLIAAYALVGRVGAFALTANEDVASLGLGFLAMGLFLARRFGAFHGGNIVKNNDRPNAA